MRKNWTDVFSLEPEYPSVPEKRFYHIEFDRETKRDVYSYHLKYSIEDQCKEKKRKTNHEQPKRFFFPDNDYRKHWKISQFHKVRRKRCRISPHKYLNQIKGILYIYEYEFNEQFKKDLIEEYPFIEDVADAPLMKPTNQHATAL